MITLQTFEPIDIPRLIKWIPDAAFLMQWAGPRYKFPLTEAQILTTFKQTQLVPPALYMFKVLDDSSTEVLGHVELLNIDREHGTATLGRVLIGPRNIRGMGFGIKMIELVLRFAFVDLNLREVELGVFSYNEPAIRLYKKLGFEIYQKVRYETDISPKFEDLVRMKLNRKKWSK